MTFTDNRLPAYEESYEVISGEVKQKLLSMSPEMVLMKLEVHDALNQGSNFRRSVPEILNVSIWTQFFDDLCA